MNQKSKQNDSSDTPKILTAFYSYSGNTRECAQEIQKLAGGDVLEIEAVEPYPEAYADMRQQAKDELRRGVLPELRQQPDCIAQYDVVILGSPNWWNTVAPPVRTFLSLYDFSGNRIAPFITHGGGGLGRCPADIAKLCPGATVVTALSVMGQQAAASRNDISAWLKKWNAK